MFWRKKPSGSSEWEADAIADYYASCLALDAFISKELRTQSDWDALARAKARWRAAALRFHDGS